MVVGAPAVRPAGTAGTPGVVEPPPDGPTRLTSSARNAGCPYQPCRKTVADVAVDDVVNVRLSFCHVEADGVHVVAAWAVAPLSPRYTYEPWTHALSV